jgi:hypothetical protein
MRIQWCAGLVVTFLTAFSTAAWGGDAPLDFHKTILPILKDSCFACHVPGADAPYASKNPLVAKKIKKEVGHALENLTMGDKFPFVDEDPAAKQLKHLDKELTKELMPPDDQEKLGLGLPLSDKNRKILLDWVAQEKNNLH